MDSVLLHTGLAGELIVAEAKRYSRETLEAIEGLCERYDATHPNTAPCTGSLICQREGVRHRQGCIGRDVPFQQYYRSLA